MKDEVMRGRGKQRETVKRPQGGGERKKNSWREKKSREQRRRESATKSPL